MLRFSVKLLLDEELWLYFIHTSNQCSMKTHTIFYYFLFSVVSGVMCIYCLCLVYHTVWQLGRKALLLLGTLNLLLSMATAATLLLAFRVEEGGSRVVSYIVVVLICYFVFNYAYSYG